MTFELVFAKIHNVNTTISQTSFQNPSKLHFFSFSSLLYVRKLVVGSSSSATLTPLTKKAHNQLKKRRQWTNTNFKLLFYYVPDFSQEELVITACTRRMETSKKVVSVYFWVVREGQLVQQFTKYICTYSLCNYFAKWNYSSPKTHFWNLDTFLEFTCLSWHLYLWQRVIKTPRMSQIQLKDGTL